MTTPGKGEGSTWEVDAFRETHFLTFSFQHHAESSPKYTLFAIAYFAGSQAVAKPSRPEFNITAQVAGAVCCMLVHAH
jgi:hypothetical protein